MTGPRRPSTSWNSVGRLFAEQTSRQAHRPFIRFLEESQVVVETYAAAWRRSLRWAALLRQSGLRRGDFVVITLPNGPDLVGAFFGTLLAGGSPSAVAPFRRRSPDRDHNALVAARLRLLDGRFIVVPPDRRLDVTDPPCGDLRDLVVLSRDQAERMSADDRIDDAAEIAFVQFTSGTSQAARAVTLRHEAVLRHLDVLLEVLDIDDPDVDSAVSWLPWFHDMGLIGFLLTPMAGGGCVTVLQPDEFVRRPVVWMRAVSDYRATITAGPGSTYQWCADRVKAEEAALLDLRSLRVALVGAEMVHEASLERFCTRFAASGFRRESITPTYGLAEACLAATVPPIGRGPVFDRIDVKAMEDTRVARPPRSPESPSRNIASVGTPVPDTTVRVVDDTGRPLPERAVGEVLIRGASVMAGYHGQPELTCETLSDGWLRTGDLGYMIDGELYITGRSKELVIVAGRNYYPDDLERIAADVPGVRRSCVAAVSVPDERTGTERIVIFAETHLTGELERESLTMAIRLALTSAGYPVHDVALLRPNTIPHTMSGKTQRTRLRAMWNTGEMVR